MFLLQGQLFHYRSPVRQSMNLLDSDGTPQIQPNPELCALLPPCVQSIEEAS